MHMWFRRSQTYLYDGLVLDLACAGGEMKRRNGLFDTHTAHTRSLPSTIIFGIKQLRQHSVSKHLLGETHAIMRVYESPPRLSISSFVSVESR